VGNRLCFGICLGYNSHRPSELRSSALPCLPPPLQAARRCGHPNHHGWPRHRAGAIPLVHAGPPPACQGEPEVCLAFALFGRHLASCHAGPPPARQGGSGRFKHEPESRHMPQGLGWLGWLAGALYVHPLSERSPLRIKCWHCAPAHLMRRRAAAPLASRCSTLAAAAATRTTYMVRPQGYS